MIILLCYGDGDHFSWLGGGIALPTRIASADREQNKKGEGIGKMRERNAIMQHAKERQTDMQDNNTQRGSGNGQKKKKKKKKTCTSTKHNNLVLCCVKQR